MGTACGGAGDVGTVAELGSSAKPALDARVRAQNRKALRHSPVSRDLPTPGALPNRPSWSGDAVTTGSSRSIEYRDGIGREETGVHSCEPILHIDIVGSIVSAPPLPATP